MTIQNAGTEREMLDGLLKDSVNYFLKHSDPLTGLVADKSEPGSPCSISVTGMGLTSWIAAVDNHLIDRRVAIEYILKLLRFIDASHQGTGSDATGYKGFYYHFLDMKTGRRAWNSELSTVDTAFFIAGVLAVAHYFTKESNEEKEIRSLGNALYLRVDWIWALNGSFSLSHGWKPESGFIRYRWNKHYNESLILYMLAMGSPSFPIEAKGYKKWTKTFELIDRYDLKYIYAGPLFIHQFSHLWIDFRGIQDNRNRETGFDYFENSNRATRVQQQYAIENPKKFEGYNENCWGLSASDGPGVQTIQVNGKKRKFYGYLSRGAPFGPDDGTVSLWSVVASLPFAPDIVLKTIRYNIENFDLKKPGLFGFESSFNPTYRRKNKNPEGWMSPCRFGLNQGAMILMIQNYYSGLIWDTMKKCPYLVEGLKKAGFEGGWLEKPDK